MLPISNCDKAKAALATTRQATRIAKQFRCFGSYFPPTIDRGSHASKESVSWSCRASSTASYPSSAADAASGSTGGAYKSPLLWREDLRNKASIVRFNIRGVTFEDRQATLESLGRGEAVLLVPEPENEYDAHAIAIKRLNGQHLGYVPRESNQYPEFLGGPHLAHVKSHGPTQSVPQYLGALVEFRPQLRPLHVLAAPRALNRALRDLDGVVHRSTFKQLCSEALQASQGRCQISGSPAKPLAAVPDWREDTKSYKFVLQGFICMAPKLFEARESMLRDKVPQQALWTVQSINGWISSEMEEYIAERRRVREAREQESWSIDTSWLNDQTDVKVQELAASASALSGPTEENQ